MMGKLIQFPTGGRDGLSRRDKDSESEAKQASEENAERYAQWRRAQFTVIEGGKK